MAIIEKPKGYRSGGITTKRVENKPENFRSGTIVTPGGTPAKNAQKQDSFDMAVEKVKSEQQRALSDKIYSELSTDPFARFKIQSANNYVSDFDFQRQKDQVQSEIDSIKAQINENKNKATQNRRAKNKADVLDNADELNSRLAELNAKKKEYDDEEWGRTYSKYMNSPSNNTPLNPGESLSDRQKRIEASSQYVSTKNGEPNFNALQGRYLNTGYDDLTYELVNKNPEALDIFNTNNSASGDYLLNGDTNLTELTDDEVKVYNYLYSSDKEKANEFLSFLNSDLNARQRARVTEEFKQMASETPIAADIYSIISSPLKAVSAIGQTVDFLAGDGIDENAAYNRFSYENTALREQRSQDVEEKWGKVGSFGYQTAMSMGDFLFNAMITGNIGAGAESEATRKAAENLSLAIMGSGASADATIAAKDRGLSDGQAFALGAVAGVAEVLTEKVSLENLLDKAALDKNALGYFIKNTIAEGSEEVGSDLINTFADILISRNQSEWNQAVQAYRDQGYNQNKAFALALADKALEMGVSFLGGAISGGVMSAGNIGIQNLTNMRTVNDAAYGLVRNETYGDQTALQSLYDTARSMGPDTRAYQLAEKFEGNPISEGQARRLIRATEWGMGYEQQTAYNSADEAVRTIRDGGNLNETDLNSLLSNPATREIFSISEELPIAEQRTMLDSSLKALASQSEAGVTDTRGNISTEENTPSKTAFFNEGRQTQNKQTAANNLAAFEFASESTVRKFANTLGEEGRSAFNSNYDGGNTLNYSRAFVQNYNQGKEAKGVGIDPNALIVDDGFDVTMARAAFNAGKRDAALETYKEGVSYESDGRGLQGDADLGGGEGSTSVSGVAGKVKTGRNTGYFNRPDIINSVKAASKEISAKQLGISSGSNVKSIYAVTRTNFNAELDSIESMCSTSGVTVRFFMGDSLDVKSKDGRVIKARGVNQGNTIYVRVDHPTLSPKQIAMHEMFHVMELRSGDQEAFHEAIKEKLFQHYSEAELIDLIKDYKAKYGYKNMSDDDIVSEILADAFAGIDIFDYLTTYQGATRFNSVDIQEWAKEVEYDTNQARAPTETAQYSEEIASIKDQLIAHQEELSGKKVVDRVSFRSGEQNVAQRVMDHYRSLGIYDQKRGGVERQGYGFIQIGQREVSSGLNYVKDSVEYSAMYSLPYVLKRGVEIGDGHINHKGRSVNTTTIAAPVEINGKRVNVAVVVTESGKNKYHAHRVLTTDGKKITYLDITKKAEPTNASMLSETDTQRPAISTTSYEDIIAEAGDRVKASEEIPEYDSHEALVNSAMTMDEAKRMIDSAWRYVKDGYSDPNNPRNASDWLKLVGPADVAMQIENEYVLHQKYINNNPAFDDSNDDYVEMEEVIEAYQKGTLVGREKIKAQRLDTSKGVGRIDNRIYAPKNYVVDRGVWDLAKSRITKANTAEVMNARKQILFAAHSMDVASELGIKNSDLNKQIRSWSNYSSSAREISQRLNNNVALENQWTGIPNCSFLSEASVTDEDILSLVKGIKGNSAEYERSYIARTMLALDTHINWTNATFEFVRGNVDPQRRTVRGRYLSDTRTIQVGAIRSLNTVAHEMGHYLDHQWASDLLGKEISHKELTTGINRDLIINDVGKQFYDNFKLFINSLTDVNDIYNEYTQRPNEVFARFIARFVEWTDKMAGGNVFNEIGSYNDKFTASQYIEFAKLLQEKAAFDNMIASEANPGIRYSEETDSTGRKLTAAQVDFFKNSEARDVSGKLLPLYHQTGSDFTIFNVRELGAGTHDYMTPFGIFLKPTSNDIGLKGKKQMNLYANIENMLEVRDRNELERFLRSDQEISNGIDNLKSIDKKYQALVDEANKAFQDYVTTHKGEDGKRVSWEDKGLRDIIDEEERIINEWTETVNSESVKLKEIVDTFFKSKGYDGVHVKYDAGSFGRSVETYIAFNSEQVKNVDNLNPTTNPDIRYSEESNFLYNKKDYNNFGWARANDVLSKNEYSRWNAQLQNWKGIRKSAAGSRIFQTGDKFGVDNVLVYTKGSSVNPIIEKVVRINADVYADYDIDTDIELIREAIYEQERKSNKEAVLDVRSAYEEGYITEYGQRDFQNYEEYRRSNARTESSRDNRNDLLNGRRISGAETEGNVRLSEDLPESEFIAEASRLREETAKLQKLLKSKEAENFKLRRELSVNVAPTVRRSDVEKLARQNLQQMNSKSKISEVSKMMEDLGNKIVQGKEYTYEELFDEAIGISEYIVEGCAELVNSDEMDTLNSIKDYFKGHEFYFDNYDRYNEVTPEYLKGQKRAKGHIQDYKTFKLKNSRRFKLTADVNATHIDGIWEELQQKFGYDYFPDITTYPDMVQHISDLLDGANEVWEIPADLNSAEVIEGNAQEILNGLLSEAVRQNAPSYADKMNLNLSRQRYKYEEKLKEVRAKRDEQIKALKDKAKNKALNRRETASKNKLKKRIEDRAKELKTLLLNPNDKKHIPEALRGSVARMLEIVNLESTMSYDIDGNLVRNRDGAPTKRTKAFMELKEELKKVAGELVIDPNFFGDEFSQGDIDEVISYGDIPIRAMNLEQLETLNRVVDAVYASVKSYNKFFSDMRYQEIGEAADALREDNINKVTPAQYKGGLGRFQKLTGLDMMTPEAYFHRLGKSGEALFRAFRNAQDNYILITKNAEDYGKRNYGNYDVEASEKTVHEVTLGGRKAKLTTAQIIEIYNLCQRGDQAINHMLYGGGIQPTDIETKGLKKTVAPEPYKGVTIEEIQDVVKLLTAEDIRVADAMRNFLSKDMSDYGNKASMRVYNYKKFGEENYWPIKVSKQETKTTVESESQQSALKNKGFTKSTTPNASNAIMIGSAFDTYSKHISDMATYSAYLEISEDLTRILNYKFEDSKRTVKGMLDTVFGRGGKEYYTKLLSDVAMGIHGEGSYMGGLTGNYKAAAVGANLRVVLQQPTAIARALSMIDGKYLVEGMKPNKGWEKALKYAPIAVWKDWGYFDINTGMQMKSILFESSDRLEKVKQAAMWAAGKMDSVGWGMLWNACESETKEKTGLTGEELYKKTAERFTEIIDRTQVVDGILQRSQIMRSADGLTKMATSFMGEPTKQYNMLLTAVYDARNNNSSEAKKRLARTVNALMVSGILNAIAQSLVDGIRDDDEEMNYWEKVFKAFAGYDPDSESKVKDVVESNLVEAFNPLGYVPFVKDVWSMIKGMDVARMDMESVSDVITKGSYFLKALNGTGKTTIGMATVDMFNAAAKFFGLPLANVKRDVMGIVNTIVDATGNTIINYNLMKLSKKIGVSSNNSSYFENLYNAYKNDEEEYKILFDRMMKDGFDEEKLTTYINNKLKKEAGVKEVKMLGANRYAGEDEDTYNAMTEALKNAKGWDKLDGDTQYKLLDKAFQISTESDSGLKEKAKYDGQVDDVEYILFKMALDVYDKPNKSGNLGTYTNDEVEEALRSIYGRGKNKDAAFLYEMQTDSKNNPFK